MQPPWACKDYDVCGGFRCSDVIRLVIMLISDVEDVGE